MELNWKAVECAVRNTPQTHDLIELWRSVFADLPTPMPAAIVPTTAAGATVLNVFPIKGEPVNCAAIATSTRSQCKRKRPARSDNDPWEEVKIFLPIRKSLPVNARNARDVRNARNVRNVRNVRSVRNVRDVRNVKKRKKSAIKVKSEEFDFLANPAIKHRLSLNPKVAVCPLVSERSIKRPYSTPIGVFVCDGSLRDVMDHAAEEILTSQFIYESELVAPVLLERLVRKQNREERHRASNLFFNSQETVYPNPFLYCSRRKIRSDGQLPLVKPVEVKSSDVTRRIEEIRRWSQARAAGFCTGFTTPGCESPACESTALMGNLDNFQEDAEMDFLKLCSASSGLPLEYLMSHLTEGLIAKVEKNFPHVVLAAKLLEEASHSTLHCLDANSSSVSM
ncbi:hypothetical protein BV898_04329 [Hypsibius exemplaris]|uniref:Uncharacterized protein n=1 Tax=Hypsibius exemplaris TaxID=2072580 RepID=A0A1W0X390_HYPEX|nr:hypothetical protein BV898_04329 [Hypsibius exemplaris]